MRPASPNPVIVDRIHASSACAGTCDCTYSVDFDGSMPAAMYCAAVRRVFSRRFGRVVRLGERVQVDHREESVVGLLQVAPLHERPDVVADLKRVGGGLHAGVQARFAHPTSLVRARARRPAGSALRLRPDRVVGDDGGWSLHRVSHEGARTTR